MNLLAIDTVTEMASVALHADQEILLEEVLVPQRHTQVILPMIQKVMATAGMTYQQLDAIVFSRGPGSFTGLRICASITQGLALAHDLPVIPVSSLAVLAQGSLRVDNKTSVVACMDARRQEVYWGSFIEQEGIMSLLGDEVVVAPGMANTEPGNSWHAVGSGLESYKTELAANPKVNLASAKPESYPLAQDAITLAKLDWQQEKYMDASLAIPTYLRDKIATPPDIK